MARRYKPLGNEPDRIFARAQSSEPTTAEVRERLEEEKRDIDVLANHAAFQRWIRRTFRAQGGMFNDCLKTDAGQAQGMALYCIARDLTRTDAGRQLVSQIVSEHFGKREGQG